MSAMRKVTVNTDSDLREAIAALGRPVSPVASPPPPLSPLPPLSPSPPPASPPTTPEQRGDAIASALHHFLDLMLKWTRVYNLTAITDRKQMITHHLVDSLAIIPSLDRLLAGQDHPRLLDVGTGAGLPGIPMAVARPDWRLTLVDSNSKKAAFVTQVTAELGLTNVTVITGRIEQLERHEQHQPRLQPLDQSHHTTAATYNAIVSRAFASLNDFVTGTRHLLAYDGTWVAMKGAVPQSEIDALPDEIACVAIVPLDVPGLDAERHLILMKEKR